MIETNKHKYKSDIFILDSDDALIINKIEVRAIPEYKAILERKTKYKADRHRELLYIYLMMNPSSMFIDLPVEDRAEKVVEACAFETEDWYPDDLVIAAMKRYEDDLKLSGLMYSFLSAKNNLYNYGRDIDYLNNRNSRLRLKIEEYSDLIDGVELREDKEEYATMRDDAIDELLKNNERANKMILNLTKAQEVVESLEKKVLEESAKKDNIYGGGTLGNREQ